MKHGEVKWINGKRVASPEYRAWQAVKNRVLNPKGQDYKHYGGRGVTMDPRWHEFGNFLSDMGRRPSPELTLDRIDGNLGYFKSNCRWATRKVQSGNRDYCILDQQKADEIRVKYASRRYTQQQLADQYGVTQSEVSQITRAEAWI